MDSFLVFSILACFILHLFLRRRFSRHRLPLPPGPTNLPVIGALPFIGPTPHSGLARLARQHAAPIMYLKMGTSGVVVVSTPSAARAFLKTLDAQFANRPTVVSATDITYNYQNMVFSNYGNKWKLMRKMASLHLLGAKALAGWAPVRRDEMGRVLKEMCDAAADKKPVVVPELLVCCLANIVGQVTLSKRVFSAQGEESNKYKDMIVELLTGAGLFNIGDFIPALAWLDLQGVQAKLKGIHDRFDAMITKMLDEHSATAKKREGRPDFIDLIMANRVGDDGETITDTNIKGLIFDLFTAGTDTSSIITEWALTEMIKNPQVLKRAQEEMDEVIGRERRLEESDISNLPYLQAVVKEAMRLHPSTPLSLPHFSYEECEVNGYYVPKNTRLLVNIWAIGRDPDTWEDPLEFKPERFLSGPTAKVDPLGNYFELIPFGAGRRICAGKLAGMVFVQYFLGTLVHSFDWRLPDGEVLNMNETFGLALPKAVPLKAMATPRLSPSAYA
ncbi:hypothetical protein LUZ62_028136 [Rhynchospora pubera]|uniref:Flavonoid 3',5'-hydroxylase n=1 Tax=Rhynchospora pubera TaxID=906938 RepID=A0AAV8CHF6_9POAL|nr:hypothetical protein LUZ62_089669 [Rhynchospora pubera]KAJ4815570.1 hypothetical protein LUZ62_028136 [Rhynchospora pubera]